ncbi:MAG: HAD family phosphatase [Actinobacteria bacterium]|nr:HAD family phosphatase [Actinomycetota bacterium]
MPTTAITAIVFDLDGVLIDSNRIWGEVVTNFVRRQGGTWRAPTPEEAMAGSNSAEWSSWFKETCRLAMSAQDVRDGIIAGIIESYHRHLPLMPGAVDTVRLLAQHFKVGLASASPRKVIDLVLEHGGLAPYFEATVSADEVLKGKPDPQVYVDACRRLGVHAAESVAVEDAPDGLRAAKAAGLWTIAVPPVHPSAADENRRLADLMVDDIRRITPEVVASVLE